jgi:hypothetical protein
MAPKAAKKRRGAAPAPKPVTRAAVDENKKANEPEDEDDNPVDLELTEAEEEEEDEPEGEKIGAAPELSGVAPELTMEFLLEKINQLQENEANRAEEHQQQQRRKKGKQPQWVLDGVAAGTLDMDTVDNSPVLYGPSHFVCS